MTPSAALTPELAAHGQEALAAWRTVIDKLGAADLERPTPCTEFTVADLVEHVQRSMTLLTEVAGGPVDTSPGALPPEQVVRLAEAALGAWGGRGVDGEVPVGSRTLPAGQAYAIVLMELAVHSWDLERALGAPGDAPDISGPLAEYLLEQARSLITPERRGRGFADPVVVGPQAGPLDRLVAFTGRAP